MYPKAMVDNYAFLSEEISNIELIFTDASNQDRIIQIDPLNLSYFYNYENIPNLIPKGYTDNPDETNNKNYLGSYKVKASEHHFKVYYRVAPYKQLQAITINFLEKGNLLKQIIDNDKIGNAFDIHKYINSIPSKYSLLSIISGGNVNEFQFYPQTVNLELTEKPTTGFIELYYDDTDTNTILSSQTLTGNIGSQFDTSAFQNNMPADYQYESASSTPTEYTAGAQIITVNIKPQMGTINIQYVSSGNTLSSSSITKQVGTSFDGSQYKNNIPSGYNYSSDNSSSITQFEPYTQTLTIHVTPIPVAPPQPQQITVSVHLYDEDSGHSIGSSYTRQAEVGETLTPEDVGAPQMMGLTIVPAGWMGCNEPQKAEPGTPAGAIDVTPSTCEYTVTYSGELTPSQTSQANSDEASEAAAQSAYDSMQASEEAAYSASAAQASANANTGSMDISGITAVPVTFNFVDRGSIMVDPTFSLQVGTTTHLHHILVLMKGEYSDVNAGEGSFRAYPGGTKFYTYDDPNSRSFTITNNTTSFTVHVHR